MDSIEVRAIGRLEGRMDALIERMERSEVNRSKRHAEIFGRLCSLEASNQFKKGRMLWVGYVGTLAAVAISAAIATFVTNYIGGK